MQVVLGVDAAWTLSRPSGVAFAIKRTNGWQLERNPIGLKRILNF